MAILMGFVHAERWENPSWTERLCCAVQKGYGTELTQRPLFGRSALFVRHRVVDGLGLRQRRARAEEPVRLLRAHGVDKVAFSGPGGDAGTLRRMDSSYLYTYLAGDVGAYVAERSSSTAVCFFRTLGQLEERALLRLAESFRYLMISVQRDSGAICRALRRRFGLPVVEDPTQSQVRHAAFALVFYPPKEGLLLSDRCMLFAPAGGREVVGGLSITELGLELPPELSAELPAGFCPQPILSEAAFRGQIDPNQIKIHGLSIDKAR